MPWPECLTIPVLNATGWVSSKRGSAVDWASNKTESESQTYVLLRTPQPVAVTTTAVNNHFEDLMNFAEIDVLDNCGIAGLSKRLRDDGFDPSNTT
jgi:hypothetical protein